MKQNPGRNKKHSKKADGGIREINRELTKIEKKWEKAEAHLLEIKEKLNDPEVFKSPNDAVALVLEQEPARDNASEQMRLWESLEEKLRIQRENN